MSEPLVIGNEYFLAKSTVFRRCILKRLLPEMGGTARVQYYSSGELLTCRQSELNTEAERDQVLKERRTASYRAYRRRELADVIALWESGLRTAEAMASMPKAQNITYWKRRIRIAKKWGFIE